MNRARLELLYSGFIVIAIPTLLIINTIWLVNNTRSDYNLELQRKADLVNLTLANAAVPYLESGETELLSDFMTRLDSQSPTISNLYITQLDGNDVSIVAAADNSPSELQPFLEQQIKIAADVKDKPIARLDNATDRNGTPTTAWTLATPIVDENGDVLAIAMSSTATTDADELIERTYTTSLIVLVGSVLVAVALLLHHYRLAGYSRLLAKQQEVNQTMTDFLSVATHELKAPTSIIKGYVANVNDDLFGEIPATAKEQLDVALAQTDRLNNLVSDLLNVSRIEQGRVEYKIDTVDLVPIIRTITSTYVSRAREKSIELVYEPQDGLPAVRIDGGRGQEIFTNLIDNAVKYTPSGKVAVSHSIDKGMLITKVRDTGPGMSSEERLRLFQRFYRVKNEHTKDIAGTGLGLWIIKQYIEQMGGKIEVDSLVGSGTEFTVYLPLAKNKES